MSYRKNIKRYSRHNFTYTEQQQRSAAASSCGGEQGNAHGAAHAPPSHATRPPSRLPHPRTLKRYKTFIKYDLHMPVILTLCPTHQNGALVAVISAVNISNWPILCRRGYEMPLIVRSGNIWNCRCVCVACFYFFDRYNLPVFKSRVYLYLYKYLFI